MLHKPHEAIFPDFGLEIEQESIPASTMHRKGLKEDSLCA